MIERKTDLIRDLTSSDKTTALNALLYASFNLSDWKWIQDKCIELLDSKDEDIKGLAITCIGHIARINGKIEKDKVLKAFDEKVREADLKGRVEDAIDDIEMFVK